MPDSPNSDGPERGRSEGKIAGHSVQLCGMVGVQLYGKAEAQALQLFFICFCPRWKSQRLHQVWGLCWSRVHPCSSWQVNEPRACVTSIACISTYPVPVLSGTDTQEICPLVSMSGVLAGLQAPSPGNILVRPGGPDPADHTPSWDHLCSACFWRIPGSPCML